MSQSAPEDPRVTLVVVPRERFSFARASLESIYTNTDIPFRLVYVDGGSPVRTRRYLQAEARTKGFELVRTDDYLPPNRARNLGLRRVRTPWVVFIDNDVVTAPGWLPPLIACGEETGADIVSPLLCEGTPIHTHIHCAGGESGVRVEPHTRGPATRHIIERIYRQGQVVADVRDKLTREPTGLAEFHCMLVRVGTLSRLGGLDEAMLSTKEHVDLCMTVMANGGRIYFEPASLVTYVPGPPLEWSDIPFYMLRWSDGWERASLLHLRQKWALAEDGYFLGRQRRLGWRRQMTIVRPLLDNFPLGRHRLRVEGALMRMDRRLNRYLTRRHARRRGAATSTDPSTASARADRLLPPGPTDAVS